MQLQYVFGAASNPRKKTKKLGKPKKASKMKQGGISVKKKRKFSKKQLAAQKRFAAMVRAGKFKKGKRKKGRNPTVIAEVPVYKKTKFSYPGKNRVAINKAKTDALEAALQQMRATDEGRSALDLILEGQSLKKVYGKAKKELSAAQKRAANLLKRHYAGEEKLSKLKSIGARILEIKPDKEDVMANPKKRRKKRKGKKNASKLHVSMNPRSKPKSGKKAPKKRKKAKKNSAALLIARGSANITKRARKSFKRKKRLKVSVRVNPDLKDIFTVYGTAALGGAAYPWFNYGVNWVIAKVDGMIGGKAGEVISKFDNMAPGVAAPSISLAAALGLKVMDQKMGLLQNLGGASKYVHQALDTIAVLSAAGIGMALANKAKLSPQAQGLSGVKFFPGAMGGADFGTYPQLGSSADFGGVKYFPKPMGGVEFFQDGSRGDEMYTSSERDDLAEVHGLGVIPEGLGVIPEGLGNADFGVIPEGLGGDEGQMG